MADRVYVRKRLDRVARAFGIKISKAHRTVYMVSAVALSRILPLDLRLKEQLQLYEIKRGKGMEVIPGRDLQRRVHPSALPHRAMRRRYTFDLVSGKDGCGKPRKAAGSSATRTGVK